MKYFALIKKESDGSYFINFPELQGCFTEGRILQQARFNATEALNLWLSVAINERNFNIPDPKTRKGKRYFPIAVELQTALAIVLKKTRRIKKLSQAQVARKPGITQQSYAKLELPLKTNPSLAILQKLSNTLNIEFHFDIAA